MVFRALLLRQTTNFDETYTILQDLHQRIRFWALELHLITSLEVMFQEPDFDASWRWFSKEAPDQISSDSQFDDFRSNGKDKPRAPWPERQGGVSTLFKSSMPQAAMQNEFRNTTPSGAQRSMRSP